MRQLFGLLLILAGVLLFASIPNHWVELLPVIALGLLTFGRSKSKE